MKAMYSWDLPGVFVTEVHFNPEEKFFTATALRIPVQSIIKFGSHLILFMLQYAKVVAIQLIQA
jgi:hypothetical protein